MTVTFLHTTGAKLSQVPKVAGQLVYITDNPDTYFDVSENERIYLGQIIELETENDRTSILAPLQKFYFVKETNSLWKFSDDWHLIAPAESSFEAENLSQAEYMLKKEQGLLSPNTYYFLI